MLNVVQKKATVSFTNDKKFQKKMHDDPFDIGTHIIVPPSGNNELFSLPLVNLGGLRYLIVALFGPSIKLFFMTC